MAASNKKDRFLELASYLLASGAMLDYALCTFLAEDSWLSMFVTYAPQAPYWILSSILLGSALLYRKKLASVLSLFSLLVFLHLENPALHIFAPVEGSAEGHSLKIVTFNLQEGIDDPIALAEAVRKADADLCAFQEANFLRRGDERAKGILAALGARHVVSNRGLTIASRWPILRSWTSTFQVPTHQWALFAEIVPDGGKPFVLASIHMNPVRWDHILLHEPGKLPDYLRFTGRIREKQAESLLQELNNIPRDTPLYFCGDFNGPPRGKVYDRLANRLQDAFGGRGFGFGWTIPSRFPLVRMDYVFLRRQGVVKSVRVLGDAGSDHLGMAVETGR